MTTEIKSEPKTFAGQMKAYFGLLPGQTLTGPDGFMAELKALDEKDRAQFTDMLNGAGYPVVAAAKPPTT